MSFWSVFGAIATGGVSTIGQIPKRDKIIKAQAAQVNKSNQVVLAVEKDTSALLASLDKEKTIVSSWLESLGLLSLFGLKKPDSKASLMDFVSYNKKVKNFELYTILGVVLTGLLFMKKQQKKGKKT